MRGIRVIDVISHDILLDGAPVRMKRSLALALVSMLAMMKSSIKKSLCQCLNGDTEGQPKWMSDTLVGGPDEDPMTGPS